MRILTFIVAVILSIFSTAVMSYISMAIPIGPWIAPTLALIGIIVFAIFNKKGSDNCNQIALATFAGSIGGIISTAIGFYFTTIYFLDPVLFATWLENPLDFSLLVGSLSLVAGLFGLWVANIFENKLIVQDKLSFPIGELVHKTIYAQKTLRKSIELAVGFVSNTIFCFFQDGLGSFKGFIPKSMTLIPKLNFDFFHVQLSKVPLFQIPEIRFDFWPMLWALGFVTGHVIAVPLLVGVASKILLVKPMYVLAFQDLSWSKYIITFCSGMVVSTAIFGLLKTPKDLFRSFKSLFSRTGFSSDNSGANSGDSSAGNLSNSGSLGNCADSNRHSELVVAKSIFKQKSFLIETLAVIALFFGFLTYFNFSIISQIYVFIFAFICAYQISIISGKIGLATMGKFATFVIVPAIFIFPISYLQIVLITAFIGISGGVASDVLFGRKFAHLAGMATSTIRKYQYLGVIVSSVFAGFVFWILIKHFGLGSEQLFALRAQNRWMLIDTIKHTSSFNYYVILLGAIFGFVLSKVKVSPLLVLGGLFMPENITLGLISGGLLALFVKHKEDKYPFWSGVYAAGSIWMLINAFL